MAHLPPNGNVSPILLQRNINVIGGIQDKDLVLGTRRPRCVGRATLRVPPGSHLALSVQGRMILPPPANYPELHLVPVTRLGRVHSRCSEQRTLSQFAPAKAFSGPFLRTRLGRVYFLVWNEKRFSHSLSHTRILRHPSKCETPMFHCEEAIEPQRS